MTIQLNRFLHWFLKVPMQEGATVKFVLGDRELEILNATASIGDREWTVRLEEKPRAADRPLIPREPPEPEQ